MQKNKYDLCSEKAKQVVKSFCSDAFIHYAMTHSRIFVVRLCRFLSGDHSIQSVTLLHADFYGPKNTPKLFLDVVMQDDLGRVYIIEFQNYDIDDDNIARFQLYSMHVLIEQYHKYGYKVHPVQLLIMNTGKLIENFEYSYHSVRMMDKNYQKMLKNGLIHMEIIQTRKMKENIDMRLRDGMQEAGIEQAMRYFYDEETHNEEPENEVSEELLELYEKYICGKHYVDYMQMELDKSLYEAKIENADKRGEARGIDKGRVEGKAEGIAMEHANNLTKRKERMKKRMDRKYQADNLEWLETCDEGQLDIIEDLLDENISYEEIKRRVILH